MNKILIKKGGILFLLSFIAAMFFTQAKANFLSDTAKPYQPYANAEKDISLCIKQAKQQNKHVLIQAGGNWCVWCLRFNKFIQEDKEIDSVLKKNFIIYHLNYSPENKNEKIFSKYKFPQRFGFPVFIILDNEGNKIHTQNSSYLEEGKGYSRKKVLEFLEDWIPEALNPNTYKK